MHGLAPLDFRDESPPLPDVLDDKNVSSRQFRLLTTPTSFLKAAPADSSTDSVALFTAARSELEYLLYKCVQEKFEKQPLKHKEFREKLIEELVTDKVSQNLIRKRPGRPPNEPKSKRLDGKLHLFGKAARGNRCVVCYKKKVRKETVYFCKTCPEKPALHPEDCFEAYHTQEKYA